MKYPIDVREGPPPLEAQLPYPIAFTDEFREMLDALVDHASKLQHYYRPGATDPSDDPRHNVVWGHYRITYSVTAREGRRWRVMTMSIPGGRYPHPLAVFTTADWLGFTGAQREEQGLLVHISAPTWTVQRNLGSFTITVIEEIK